MDAVTLLKKDHQTVESLFSQFERTKDDAGDSDKRELVDRITAELEAHAAIEEEIYYPEVRAKAEEEGRELVAEAYEEHHVMKILLDELKELPPSEESFDAKMTVLIENTRHHVEEEEEEMLPQSEEILGKQRLAELGERMAERKRQLLAGGTRPSAPGGGERTRDELYEQAQRLGVKGRSRMNKDELAKAVAGAS
jgi:hypothetical protein